MISGLTLNSWPLTTSRSLELPGNLTISLDIHSLILVEEYVTCTPLSSKLHHFFLYFSLQWVIYFPILLGKQKQAEYKKNFQKLPQTNLLQWKRWDFFLSEGNSSTSSCDSHLLSLKDIAIKIIPSVMLTAIAITNLMHNFHWGLQSGDIRILPYHLHLLSGNTTIKRNVPTSTICFYNGIVV